MRKPMHGQRNTRWRRGLRTVAEANEERNPKLGGRKIGQLGVMNSIPGQFRRNDGRNAKFDGLCAARCRRRAAVSGRGVRRGRR